MNFLTTICTDQFCGSIASEQRSLENPMFSLQDPSTFEAMGIGMPSSAGIRVDRRTILTLDTWYRAVDLVSDYVMRCDLEVRRWIGKDNSVADIEHPAFRLVYQAARSDTGHKGSEYLGACYWKKTMQAHASNHGNAYSYIDRDPRSGRPRQLVPLAPDRTYPVRVNGKKYYVTHVAADYIGGSDGSPENVGRPVHDTMIVLRPEDVWHLKGLGYDCMMGYTTFDLAGETAGQAIATRQYGSQYFANNAEPRVVVEMPAGQIWTIPEKQEFVREFNVMHSGGRNSHRTAILTNGAKISPFPTSAAESQLIANRQMSARDVANWHKLPPHKLGDSSRTSYNSLELEEYSMLNDCLEPWFKLWAEECGAKLLTEEQKRNYSHFFAFDINNMVHTTLTARATANATRVNNGLACRDDIRAEENKPPLPDGIGQVITVPVNLAILHAADKKPAVAISGIPQKQGQMPSPAGTPRPADQKSREGVDGGKWVVGSADAKTLAPPFDCAPIRAVIRDAAERVYARLTKAMAAAARHPERFGEWQKGDALRHAEAVAEILRPAINLRALIPGAVTRNDAPTANIIDAWLASHGDPARFTVESILEAMQ